MDESEYTPPAYGEKEYWEQRYQNEYNKGKTYDWFYDYSNPEIRNLIKTNVKTTDSILMVGCGNSRLSEQMFEDDYLAIISIDFANSCIETMKQRASELKYWGLTYLLMDARKMAFDSKSFHTVIDKGTIDSVLCGNNSTENLQLLLDEIHRVLKPGGIFISISYGVPNPRVKQLIRTRYQWKLNSITTLTKQKDGRESQHFIYVVQRFSQSEMNIENDENSTNRNIIKNNIAKIMKECV